MAAPKEETTPESAAAAAAAAEEEVPKTAEAEAEAEAGDEGESKTLDLSGDGGVLKDVLTKGDGTPPPHNTNVHVHYVGTLASNGDKFDSSRDRGDLFKFKLGAGQVIKAWDIGVASMTRGEKCMLTCRADYAYGEHGSPPTIPGGATLKFEVELFDWDEPEPETHAQRLAAATKRKAEGNELFGAGNFQAAARKYEKAVGYFEFSHGLSDDDRVAADALKLPCLLNLAMCQLKTGDYSDAVLNCSMALDIDTKNVKALFRRAKAQTAQAEYKAAKRDLVEAVKYDPSNRELRTEFARVKRLEAAAVEKERAMARKAFGF